MQQAQDFQDESEAIHALLSPLSDEDYAKPTLFKGWTIDEVLRHLHVWNIAADLALSDAEAFRAFLGQMAAGIRGGRLPDFEKVYLDGLSGTALRDSWITQVRAMTPRFAAADPKARVPWVGPEMSVLSSITARLMESWAHAQAVYDALGVERVDADRIGNIVRLGVNTYGWTFKNRKEEPPGPMPRLRLTAPSGAFWEYGDSDDLIEGSASEFCQVVTQCRNIGDTALSVYGPVATRWMAIAQCFAGPPQDPPPPGARHRA
ncbi:TIGR03084 family protein [Sphingorhabdus pulchriflava]|uniref:TIGR03084 family protein n=1 Tax=Sphingorhabdus pulchriflava TaxID=2292257 RepID=A0A371BJE4_9SPHN|nr:TIGR03084 family metal-binding protein [Sphingorhabdus pulchriflava]RDV07702.1 TIGR03084 family protein [Sphingorhabdus pulchriflava]